MWKIAVAAALMIIVAVQGTAYTVPEPSLAPLSWELDIELHPLRSIQVKVPGKDEPQLFWYLRYTLTNNTGQDQSYVPEFVLYTDTGDVLRAGKNVPAVVFETIKKVRNEPLLKDMTGMTGKVLQGQDNAKDGVAIWPDFDHDAGEVDIFIGGLTGETQEIKLPRPIKATEVDPVTGEEKTVEKDKIIVSKTLHLEYVVTGDPMAADRTPAELKKKNWVMR